MSALMSTDGIFKNKNKNTFCATCMYIKKNTNIFI